MHLPGRSARGIRARRHVARAFLATALSLGLLASVSAAASGAPNAPSFSYWSMWKKGEPQQVVIQRAIDAFTKQTGIKVNVQWQGRDVLTKVRASLNAGKAPDLTDQDGNSLRAALVSANQALPLGDVLNARVTGEKRTVRQVIPAKYLSPYLNRGQPFVIPYELISSAVWFDRQRLSGVAANRPTTLSSFWATLDTSKRAGRAAVAQDGDINFYNAYWFYWLAERYFGPGGLAKAAGDRSGKAWDDPRWLSVARGVERLVEGGYLIDGYDGGKWPQQQTAWANGQADFLLMGSWAPSETCGAIGRESCAKVKYDSFQFPTVPGGKRSVEVYLIGFSVPKPAKNAAEAKRFIQFFLGKKHLRGISSVAKNLTPRRDIAAPVELASLKKALESATATHQIYDGIDGKYPDYWKQVFMPLDDSLFFGKSSAAEFVKEIKAKSVEFWKTR